jgi:hypothetical protein
MMTQIGHLERPTAVEFFAVGAYMVPNWYRQLIHLARAHQSSGRYPTLALAPRPFVDFRKEIVTDICQAMGLNEVEWPVLREEEV